MLYYVIVPSNHVKGTVWECSCLAYTDNEFTFRLFVNNTLGVLENFDDVCLYEFQASDTDELFKKVYEYTGYKLTVNHQLEIFESTNNPQYALVLTVEFIDDIYSGSWDYIFDMVELLWNSLTKLQSVIHIVCLPNYAMQTIKLLFDKYCFLCCLFMYASNIQDIDNLPLREAIEQLVLNAGLSGSDAKYFGITELTDDTLMLLKAIRG